MRFAREKFTIGRLMLVILLAGLAIGGAVIVHALRTPTASELAALASYDQAKLTREVSEYALKEYLEGTYAQDRATYQGMLAQASVDKDRAVERLKNSTNQQERGQDSQKAKIVDQLDVQAADLDIEQATLQLEVLEKYTLKKQRNSLLGDIEKARAAEQASKAAYETERTNRIRRVFGF